MGKTPVGILIISILFMMGGIYSIIKAIGSWVTFHLVVVNLYETFGMELPFEIYLYFYIFLILDIMISILLIIVAYGFIQIKKWSWKLGIATLIFVIMTNLILMITIPTELKEDLELSISFIGSTIYSSIILIYLFTPKVRSFFKIQPREYKENQYSRDTEQYSDRTSFEMQASNNDENFVRRQIHDWISRNKGKILSENSDGTRIKIGVGMYINPKINRMVIKFKKGAAIIFELELTKENNKMIVKGEGYVPQMGNLELDLDPNSFIGGIPRRKGYKLLYDLKSILSPTSIKSQISPIDPHL